MVLDTPHLPARQVRLSPQQDQIARGIARGLSYSEIGTELSISEHTVRTYVRLIAEKLEEPHELPPRWRILFYVRFQEWLDAHQRRAAQPA